MAESPGFTGLGAPSPPGFPVSPLSGQCINWQPWLRALTHRVAPLMRGPPGARAAGPVLLACRQFDPLGLARRLPCLRVVAWRSAPLLPLRVQCPVCVCAALATGSGGSGRYLVLSLSRFPFPTPGCPALRVAGRPVRVSLTLACWYAIPRGLSVPRARSGCSSGSPRVPFACVCAHAPAASAPPPTGRCGMRTSRGPCTGRW